MQNTLNLHLRSLLDCSSKPSAKLFWAVSSNRFQIQQIDCPKRKIPTGLRLVWQIDYAAIWRASRRGLFSRIHFNSDLLPTCDDKGVYRSVDKTDKRR